MNDLMLSWSYVGRLFRVIKTFSVLYVIKKYWKGSVFYMITTGRYFLWLIFKKAIAFFRVL